MEYDFNETWRENPRTTKLLQQLQKAFTVVKTNLKVWNEAIQGSQRQLNSVRNLSEQRHCCVQAQGLQEITQKFPNVKEKLMFKIDKEIDNHMTHLFSVVDICKEVSDKVVKQNERCQTLYNTVCEDLSLITKRSPTCPSVVEMMEWLQDIECLMMKQHSVRKHLLDKLSIAVKDQDSALYKQWENEDTELHQTVNGYLSFLEFFLDIKIVT